MCAKSHNVEHHWNSMWGPHCGRMMHFAIQIIIAIRFDLNTTVPLSVLEWDLILGLVCRIASDISPFEIVLQSIQSPLLHKWTWELKSTGIFQSPTPFWDYSRTFFRRSRTFFRWSRTFFRYRRTLKKSSSNQKKSYSNRKKSYSNRKKSYSDCEKSYL